jgi:hypothetical protein
MSAKQRIKKRLNFCIRSGWFQSGDASEANTSLKPLKK